LKKSRNTRQRTVILNILRKSDHCHPTAEAIYREAQKSLPNISLGTVYRNLNFLRDQGMVREIRSNSAGSSRFEGENPPHAHFHCTLCHAVHDVPLPEALLSFRWEDKAPISSIRSLDLHVVGACVGCGSAQV
jgi:Fe2+ or Zn2+ uptake regulation protein